MAQIFVSHSARDVDFRNLFANAFAGTKVKGVFEEFERILAGKVTREQIARDIEGSNAVFVILSENVEKIKHTRDWVVAETGAAKNKDIWVFEPYSQYGKISVVIPYLRHYGIFAVNDAWLGYLRRIIESYDDSHVLPTVLVTGGAGAIIGYALAEKDKGSGVFWGGVLGALAGLAVSDKSKQRPFGVTIRCDHCTSVYSVHISEIMKAIRCPICNKSLEVRR
jgi:hypothetical protein